MDYHVFDDPVVQVINENTLSPLMAKKPRLNETMTGGREKEMLDTSIFIGDTSHDKMYSSMR